MALKYCHEVVTGTSRFSTYVKCSSLASGESYWYDKFKNISLKNIIKKNGLKKIKSGVTIAFKDSSKCNIQFTDVSDPEIFSL